MKKLTQEFAQYKHYIIILTALIVANYVIVPLSEWQTEQLQTYSLMNKKSNKVENLLSNQEQYQLQADKVNSELANIRHYVFTDETEAKFKLTVQSKIEEMLKASECDVDRIGYKGNTIVDKHLSKWRIELRYKGDAVCLTKATRAVESATPLLNVESYNLNHRGFDTQAKGTFNAVMSLNAWHLMGGKQ